MFVDVLYGFRHQAVPLSKGRVLKQKLHLRGLHPNAYIHSSV